MSPDRPELPLAVAGRQQQSRRLHAVFLLGYFILFALLLFLLRVLKRAPELHITGLDLVLLCLATFRLTQIVTEEKVAQFLRAPFVVFRMVSHPDGSSSEEEEPSGVGLRRVVGELLLCPWCTGVWIATFITFCHVLWPAVARVFLLALAVAAGAIAFEILIKVLDRVRKALPERRD